MAADEDAGRSMPLESVARFPAAPTLMHEFWRLVRFGFVGIVSTAAYAGLSWFLVWSGATTIMVATIIAYAVAATISYLGSVYITFAVEPDHATLASRFLVVLVVNFLLALAITWLITHVFLAPHYVAIVAVVVVIPVVSYLSQRLWVFSPHLAPPPTAARNPDR